MPQQRTLTVLLGQHQGQCSLMVSCEAHCILSASYPDVFPQEVSLMCARVAPEQRPSIADIHKIHPCHLPVRWDIGQGRILHLGPQISPKCTDFSPGAHPLFLGRVRQSCPSQKPLLPLWDIMCFLEIFVWPLLSCSAVHC